MFMFNFIPNLFTHTPLTVAKFWLLFGKKMYWLMTSCLYIYILIHYQLAIYHGSIN